MRTLMTPHFSWGSSKSGFEEDFFAFAKGCFDGSALVVPFAFTRGELWRDSWERLAQMIPRACLGFLIKAGGWARNRWLRDDDRVVVGRIWEHPRFIELTFTVQPELLELIYEVFEVIAREKTDADYELDEGSILPTVKILAQHTDPSSVMTQELIYHLLTRPLATLQQMTSLAGHLSATTGYNHLTIGSNVRVPCEIDADIIADSLLRWGWALPWLSNQLAWWWVRADLERFGGGLDHYSQVLSRLTSILDAVVGAAETHSRLDLLIPVVEFFRRAYADQPTSAESLVEPLEWMTEGLPMSERQQYRDEWGRLLQVARRVGNMQTRVLHLHPADRDPPATLFLAHAEQRKFDEVLNATESLREHLERVIS